MQEKNVETVNQNYTLMEKDWKVDFFKMCHEKFPMSVYQTQNGYLKLNDKQKSILQEQNFNPNKHVFASVTEGGNIKFYEMRSNHPKAFEKYVNECEKNVDCLPYIYLGLSNKFGKINIENI